MGQKGPDGKRYYYLRDRLGSIIGVVNSTGQRVNDYWYDPFGDYHGGKNPDPAQDIPLVNWRYTGEWLDTTNATTGNYKIGLRYFDPGMHRWIQTDPAERITNPAQPAETQPYTYVGCNPTNQTDPTGAFDLGGFGEAAALVGACGTGLVLGAEVGAAVGVLTPVGPLGGGAIGGLAGCAGNVLLGGMAGVAIGEGGIA